MELPADGAACRMDRFREMILRTYQCIFVRVPLNASKNKIDYWI